jgi:hypothetical protein
MVSSAPRLNCVLAKMVPTTESKSVSWTVPVQVRNLPVTTIRFLSEHSGTFIHRWLPPRSILTGLSQVVSTTELKSVPLGMPKFKTCRQRRFFYWNTPRHSVKDGFVDHSSWLVLGQVVLTTDCKSVSLGSPRFETSRQRVVFSYWDMP